MTLQIQYVASTQSGPFSQSELDGFRRQLRIDSQDFEFDPAYLEFIKSNNGGEPVRKFFEVGDQGWYSIDRILNFTDSSSASEIDLIFNVHQTWNLIEDRLLAGMHPIAALSSGDFLLIDSSEGAAAEVVLWEHERSSEDKPSIQLVAVDFTAFVFRLRTSPSAEDEE